MTAVKSRLSTKTRQEEIVKTVLALASERSPSDITTSDIAETMGLSQGAVFRHFPTKEAIWLAVAEWMEATLLAALKRAAESSSGPLDALANVFRAHVKFVMDNPGAPRLIFQELQRTGDSSVKRRVQAMLHDYRSLVLVLIKRAKTSGDIRQELDQSCAAALFIGAVQGLVMQAMLAGSTRKMKSLAEGVLKIYLSGIEAGKQ